VSHELRNELVAELKLMGGAKVAQNRTPSPPEIAETGGQRGKQAEGIVNFFISPDEFSPLEDFFGLFHGDSSRKKAEKPSLFPTFMKK
jgi:hypothetical protein